MVILLALVPAGSLFSQEFTDLYPDNVITDVQPMTGIVLWSTSGKVNTDAISLEYSYMLFNEVVSDSGVYNWDAVEQKLDAIAGRGHQAIFRFRFVYPGYETSVPDYILERSDYNETVGKSEGRDTHFPDWTNGELKRFTLEFYTKFSGRYDNDPRLAFIQVGFGLWAEYHIYDGPFRLGETFPSKEFQEEFFHHMAASFEHIPWSISIDAADDTYTPFEAKPALKEIAFGLFDDSFMHKSHAGYNTSGWNFFDRERYRNSPAGGEFSYYSDYDQEHVLDYPNGPYGKPFETFAKDFHITYMIGNDQPGYQSMERIKEASMASGYMFKIARLQTATDTSVFEITNVGPAPIYYDAYVAVDGIQSPVSLKLLARGDTLVCGVRAGAVGAEISIVSDKLVEGQEIQFFGTQEITAVEDRSLSDASVMPYPNPVAAGETVFLEGKKGGANASYFVYDSLGRLALSGVSGPDLIAVPTAQLHTGIYFLKVAQNRLITLNRFMIL